MDLIRCHRCAKQVSGVARFCTRCGCVLENAVPFSAGTVMPAMTPPILTPPVNMGLELKPAAASRGVEYESRVKPVPPAVPEKKKKSGGIWWGALVLAGVNAARIASHWHSNSTPPSPAPVWTAPGSSSVYPSNPAPYANGDLNAGATWPTPRPVYVPAPPVYRPPNFGPTNYGPVIDPRFPGVASPDRVSPMNGGQPANGRGSGEPQKR